MMNMYAPDTAALHLKQIYDDALGVSN